MWATLNLLCFIQSYLTKIKTGKSDPKLNSIVEFLTFDLSYFNLYCAPSSTYLTVPIHEYLIGFSYNTLHNILTLNFLTPYKCVRLVAIVWRLFLVFAIEMTLLALANLLCNPYINCTSLVI